MNHSAHNPTGSVAKTNRTFAVKRAAIGVIAVICLVVAGVLFATLPDINSPMLAAFARIGIVLFAVWLALPQLRYFLERIPAVLPGIALLMLAVCAARPSLFRILGTLSVVTAALIAISAWIAKVTNSSRK